MIRGDLDHIARLLGGKLHGPAAPFAGVAIDTRRGKVVAVRHHQGIG